MVPAVVEDSSKMANFASEFASGLASGLSSARQNRAARQKAEQQAAQDAFSQQLQLKKMQIEEENTTYQRQQDEEKKRFDREKFDYEKSKDTKSHDLEVSKFNSEKDFKGAQQKKIELEIGKMAKSMSREELESQSAYFATWNSLSPQQQTEQSRIGLVNNAHASGLIDDKTHQRLLKAPLPEFGIIARTGLYMSTKALDAQKYLGPQEKEKAPSGYQWKEGDKELEAIPGGPAGKSGQVSVEKAKLMSQAENGLNALNEISTAFKDGSFSSSTLWGTAGGKITPNALKSGNVQQYENLRDITSEMFGRMQSGGAINKDEEDRFKRLLPAPGDTEETINSKLKRANEIFNNVQKNIGGTSQPDRSEYTLPSGKKVTIEEVKAAAKSLGISTEEALKKINAIGAPGGASMGEPIMKTDKEKSATILGVRG